MYVMLSKIQRLEKKVAQLEAQQSSKHPNECVSSLKKRINMIELRQNETNNSNSNTGSALDAYLNDIDLIENFQYSLFFYDISKSDFCPNHVFF